MFVWQTLTTHKIRLSNLKSIRLFCKGREDWVSTSACLPKSHSGAINYTESDYYSLAENVIDECWTSHKSLNSNKFTNLTDVPPVANLQCTSKCLNSAY